MCRARHILWTHAVQLSGACSMSHVPPSLPVCSAGCPESLTSPRCWDSMANLLAKPVLSYGKYNDLVQESSRSALRMSEFTHPGTTFSRNILYDRLFKRLIMITVQYRLFLKDHKISALLHFMIFKT